MRTLLSGSRTASVAALDSGGGAFSPDYSGSSSQRSRAPTRPPTAPTKNAAGSFAIGYYSWTNSQTVGIPKNGNPFPATGVCHLDGSTDNGITFDNIPEAPAMAVNMVTAMIKKGWTLAFNKGDANLSVNSIRRGDQGGGEIFTQATIGLFLDHGDYGTDPDYSPGSSGSKQTYFRSDADGGDNGWLRMCQFGFGGNLKWMGILACNSLTTYSSMPVRARFLSKQPIWYAARRQSRLWGRNLARIGLKGCSAAFLGHRKQLQPHGLMLDTTSMQGLPIYQPQCFVLLVILNA